MSKLIAESVDFVTKDWRGIALTGLACIVGLAFIATYLAGKADKAPKIQTIATAPVTNERTANPPKPTNPVSPEYINGKKVYDHNKLTVLIPQAACEYWGDIDKYINLRSADQDDVAALLDCISLPPGWEVIYVDELGSQFTQVLVKFDGQKRMVWMRSGFLKNELQIAVTKECGLADKDCATQVQNRFIAR